MCGISYHFFEHKVSRNSIEIAAAPADSHGGDHTAQFVAALQGGGGGGGGGWGGGGGGGGGVMGGVGGGGGILNISSTVLHATRQTGNI